MRSNCGRGRDFPGHARNGKKAGAGAPGPGSRRWRVGEGAYTLPLPCRGAATRDPSSGEDRIPVCTAGVAGCQALEWRADAGAAAAQESAPAPAAARLPFPEPERPETDLTPDAVYSFLVGEIAADRGELPLAYNHYSHSALLTRDPYARSRRPASRFS